MFARLDIKVCLAAPTGRAAKRMTAATDMPAKTIHRLLECEYGADDKLAFQRNEDNPLDYGAVIADEASMVDIFLFSALLRAMRPGTRCFSSATPTSACRWEPAMCSATSSNAAALWRFV